MATRSRKPSASAAVAVSFKHKGFAGRVGFGDHPAVVVVDAIVGFTTPSSPLGSPYDGEIAAIGRLLTAARRTGVPVAFTTVVYDDAVAEAGAFLDKVPSLALLARGSRWVTVDPRLKRRATEPLFEKKFASAFFGTTLMSWLVSQHTDTVIIAGFTTSGCVRASVVDALQHGFRPIVPRDCIGDRSAAQHGANLVDIEAKYGDVVTVDEAIAQVAREYTSPPSRRRPLAGRIAR